MPTLLWDGRFALATGLLAGFGRASAEVGAVLIVGGNIDGFTRVMTTSIALETSKGDLPLALGLGIVLLSLTLLINAAALWVAARVVSGIHLPATLTHLLLVALVFGLVNVTIKPVLKLLAFPVQILTLGLFTLVINAGMLMLTGWMAKGWGFAVDGFWSAVGGAVIVGVTNLVMTILMRTPGGGSGGGGGLRGSFRVNVTRGGRAAIGGPSPRAGEKLPPGGNGDVIYV